MNTSCATEIAPSCQPSPHDPTALLPQATCPHMPAKQELGEIFGYASKPLRRLCLRRENSISRQQRLWFEETRFECVIISAHSRMICGMRAAEREASHRLRRQVPTAEAKL